MRKIIYLLPLIALMASCMQIDNYDEPSSRLSGKVIDQTTGQNFIAGHGDFNIRIWETSFADNPNPSPQDIHVRQDGTFNNERLFAATYAMQPYGGPFWPTEREEGIELKKSLTKDFSVTPYLHNVDVTSNLVGTNLKLTCRLKAPVTQNLPRVLDIRPFVSLTEYVGESSAITPYNGSAYQVNINTNWWDGVGDMATGQGSQVYTIPDLPLKSGRTYYVRIGARVEDTYRKYNYSDIITVTVP